jgi:hypothetical protein
MAREGVPLPVIQRQLGHAHLGITSLQGIDTSEIINTVHARRAPMIPAMRRTQALAGRQPVNDQSGTLRQPRRPASAASRSPRRIRLVER